MSSSSRSVLLVAVALLALLYTPLAAVQATNYSTESSLESIGSPLESTESPLESTEPPLESTEPPLESTEPPHESTKSPLESTESPESPPGGRVAPLAKMHEWLRQQPGHLHNSSLATFSLLEVEAAIEEIGSTSSSRADFNLRCAACRKVAKYLVVYINLGGKMAPVGKLFTLLCTAAVYGDKAVCSALIDQYQDHLHYIIKKGSVSGDQICSLLMSGSQLRGDCGIYRGPSWEVALPARSRAAALGSASSAGALPSASSAGVATHRPAPLLATFSSNETQTDDDVASLRANTSSSVLRSAENLARLELTGQGGSSEQRKTRNPSVRRDGPPYPSFNDGRPYLKVLHLTDLHYDPDYREGSSAVCDATLCCRPDSGEPRWANESAGRWGDYRVCDSPLRLVKNLLEHIQQQHSDLDYIMWTGDNVGHMMWVHSPDDTVSVTNAVTALLQQYFPDVPVYAAVGNHEGAPTNIFPPPEVPKVWKRFSNQWLYDTLVQQWQSLVPDTPIAASARVAGCYSMPVRDGFRIISINTIFCDKYNLWVLYKSIDPGNVLSWLVGELQSAEESGEYVHIIGHIAPLYIDCYEEWRHQFSRIVTRFSHIITGQFYGHYHRDEVRIHFDVDKPSLPVGVQYLTPNNGPYVGYNPSFRIFYVDGDHDDSTRAVLDYETHFMNLTRANLMDDTSWQLLYRAKHDLGLASLQPAEWLQFVQRLKQDEDLARRWFKYQVQASDTRLASGCDSECQHDQICNILDGDKFLPSKC